MRRGGRYQLARMTLISGGVLLVYDEPTTTPAPVSMSGTSTVDVAGFADLADFLTKVLIALAIVGGPVLGVVYYRFVRVGG